jgi:regulator of sigma E protease
MEYLVTAGYIVLCVLLFSLAIAIHEFGHFIVALKLGLTVKCFSIGFGPAIWKKTWRGVEYRISCIPLGGYVSIPDVDPEGTKVIEGEGGKKAAKKIIPAWKELLVAVAGPMMNLALAVVLAFLLALVPSARFGELPAEISKVLENGPAAKAGIKTGDTVIAVGGRKVANWTEMQVEFQIAGEKATEVLLKDKNGAERTVTVVPERDKASGACFIKALSLPNEKMSSSWMPHRNPLRQLAWDAGSIFRILKGLVNPKESKNTAKALGGPQMIAEQIYRSIRKDIWDGVGFLRFLNVNLAIFNLLPIPVLDGGLIMFALFAIVFRRRVPEKVVSSLSLFFMVLLFAAMGTLVFRDVQRSWRLHNQEKADVQQESDQVTEDR